MKDASWEECIMNYDAVKVSPDKGKANSLLETAKERIVFLDKNKLDETNARFIFEGYYSSAIEIIHALLALKGFKVENHICLAYYLRDVMKEEKLFRIFDDSKFKRNSAVYYGKKLDFEIAKESIGKMKMLIREIRRITEKISLEH